MLLITGFRTGTGTCLEDDGCWRYGGSDCGCSKPCRDGDGQWHSVEVRGTLLNASIGQDAGRPSQAARK